MALPALCPPPRACGAPSPGTPSTVLPPAPLSADSSSNSATCCAGGGQAARALILPLRFAGGASWEKTRRLPEASGHDEDLRTVACQLMDAAGLQRGRLIGITVRAGDLIDARQAAQQISLAQAREARLVAEEAMDRIPERFAPRAIGSAAALRASCRAGRPGCPVVRSAYWTRAATGRSRRGPVAWAPCTPRSTRTPNTARK